MKIIIMTKKDAFLVKFIAICATYQLVRKIHMVFNNFHTSNRQFTKFSQVI